MVESINKENIIDSSNKPTQKTGDKAKQSNLLKEKKKDEKDPIFDSSSEEDKDDNSEDGERGSSSGEEEAIDIDFPRENA